MLSELDIKDMLKHICLLFNIIATCVAQEEWNNQTCNCGVFIAPQFPEVIDGPITWMPDTQVSLSCFDGLEQADSECDVLCKEQGILFEQNYDLHMIPPDEPGNPNPFNNTAGELSCAHLNFVAPELMPVQNEPMQVHRRLPLCHGTHSEIGWNNTASYVTNDKLCCDEFGTWIQNCP